jgi:eukaryotic-like serine/threonine-protein kinase
MAAAEVTCRLEPSSGPPTAGPVPLVLQVGQRLAERFTVLGFISAGGMGEVYDAFDAVVGTRLALKVVRNEVAARPLALERLRSEVQLARRVSHRNVNRIFDLFASAALDGSPLYFLTMERLEGTTLEAHVSTHGRMLPEAAFPILRQVSDAIDASHCEGVVHCDIKASNVMLVPRQADGPRAVVTDFGIAQSQNLVRERGATSTSCGTPSCMAPEQRENREVGPPADIYAFGRLIQSVVEYPRTGAAGRRWRQGIASCLEPDPLRRPGNTACVIGQLFPQVDPLPLPRVSTPVESLRLTSSGVGGVPAAISPPAQPALRG